MVLVFHLNVQTQKFTYLMPSILTSPIQLSLRMKQLEQQAEEQKTIPTLISKQERLFLNSVSSIYSRRAYSYFLHNYLKQQGNGGLEQFLSTNPKEIEDELIDFIITSKEKGMKRAAIFNYIKPVISCCKINDVAINTTKVRKFMPPKPKCNKSYRMTR